MLKSLLHTQSSLILSSNLVHDLVIENATERKKYRTLAAFTAGFQGLFRRIFSILLA